MLIWANESEINAEFKANFEKMYGEILLKMFKPWELSIILRQIQRHFGDRKDISILDFGAGVSPFPAYLNHLGYQSVTCLDKKRGWHRKMNQEIYNENYDAHVKYIKIDIIQDYDGKHDVIFSASVLEHIGDETRIEVMQALFRHLKLGGLVIHVIDYDEGINIKDLIDNCGVPISYKPEETPGCKEFKNPPEYAWWIPNRKKTLLSRIAFFNEQEA